MSSRRLARAGISSDGSLVNALGVPVPLLSMQDRFWSDADAVIDLASELGLELRLSQYRGGVREAPWWVRFTAFREAWCKANGFMSATHPNSLDWHRMREAGVDGGSTSRYRLRAQPPKQTGA